VAANVITCAFCEGSGRDPFGLLSGLSRCQVCGGIGSVTIEEPLVRCAFCGGGGVHPHQRLTCTCCGGKGMISVREPAQKCPHCQGTGAELPDQGFLPCALCRGAGLVALKEKAAAARQKVEQPA
jgi:DnaJ-class molecular chaperone